MDTQGRVALDQVQPTEGIKGKYLMIEKLQVKNLQPFSSYTLEFSPGVTTIIGPTDSGKSALLRALRWVCLNQPTGDSLLRHGETDVTASLWADGERITRSKGTKGNLYRQDKTIYRAFGSGKVPDEIAQRLNVSGLNFARQVDFQFWFALTPGQVAKELNTIVNLGAIDEVLTRLASRHRTVKSRVEAATERLSQAREEVAKLDWVPSCKTSLYQLEEQKRTIEETRLKHARIVSLLAEEARASTTIQSVSRGILALGKALKVGEKVLGLQKRRERLGKLIRSLQETQSLLDSPSPDVQRLVAIVERRKVLSKQQESLRKLLDGLSRSEKEVERCRKGYQEAEWSLGALKPKGACPVCGRKSWYD